jgi:hypothetical protein
LIALPLVGLVILMLGLSACAAGPRTYGSGEPPSRIDFFDARGNRTGYGIIQGGRVDFFKPNGVRSGSGVVGR